MQPLISILIPAFNAAPWIRECVESALNQTYPRIEVIVVDDGSTDETAQIVEQFSNVRLIRAKHAGSNATRNALLRLANGDWVQYLDADDYLLNHKIAAQIQFLGKHPSLDVLCSPVILKDEHTGLEQPLLFTEPDDIELQFIRWGKLNTTGFLYRRSALIDAGGWKEQQVACQEHELLFRMILQQKQIACLHEPGSVYRFHGTSTVSRKDPLRTVQLKAELLEQMQAHLEGSGRLSAQYRRALYIARMESARKVWSVDGAYAANLAATALSAGRFWNVSSPALPLLYRVAHTLFGFSAAEHLAAFYRLMRPPV